MSVYQLLFIGMMLSISTVVARDPFYLENHSEGEVSKSATVNGVVSCNKVTYCLVCDDEQESDTHFLREGDSFQGHCVAKISTNSLVLEKEQKQVELTFD